MLVPRRHYARADLDAIDAARPLAKLCIHPALGKRQLASPQPLPENDVSRYACSKTKLEKRKK
jgi:hypothetical protein